MSRSGTGGALAEGGAPDGRVLRGERTRSAIAEALLSLLGEGVLQPTSAQIAERAGVSVRSIFQHFDDLEALHADLAIRQAERVAPLIEGLDTQGTLEERLDALVQQRAELFEFITPIRHALGIRVYSSPAIRHRIDEVSDVLRLQVEAQFEPELSAMPEDRRTTTLAAVDAMASFQTWDLLRVFQSLSRAETERTLTAALAALVA